MNTEDPNTICQEDIKTKVRLVTMAKLKEQLIR